MRLAGVLTFAFLAVLGSSAASVDEPAPLLTLDDAVAIATQHNRLLRAASAAANAAESGVDEARAARLPHAELGVSWSRTTNPALVFSNLLAQEAFGPTNFEIARLNEPDALGNVASRVTVTQPVWTGGRIAGGIAAAKSARDAGVADRERTRQVVVHGVIDAYTAAVLAAARLAVAVESLATADEHVRLARDLRDGGLVVDSDLLQAQVRRSEVEELRIRAESAVAVSRGSVNLALGRDLDTPFRLPAALTPSPPGDDPLDVLLAEATANRPDLHSARRAADAAGHRVETERAGRLPQVGVSGSYEGNSERWFDDGGTNWTVAAGATFTLFDGRATGSRVRRAESEHGRAAALRDYLAEAAGLEVRRAYHELRAARSRRDQAAGAVGLARENLRIVEDRYREGLTTVVELLDAETALTDARVRDLAAQRDIVVAGAALDLAVGRL